jgi:hypothetical protein
MHAKNTYNWRRMDARIDIVAQGTASKTPADTREKNRKISNIALIRLIDMNGPRHGAPPGPHITQFLDMNS